MNKTFPFPTLFLALCLAMLLAAQPAQAQIAKAVKQNAAPKKTAVKKKARRTSKVRRVIEDYAVADSAVADIDPRDKYEYASDWNEGLAVVYNGEYYGMIDGDGVVEVDFVYKDITVDVDGGLYYRVRNYNNKLGVLDAKGEEVVPCVYDYMGSFVDGLAKVKHNELYGFVNRSGQEVVPCAYTSIGNADKAGRMTVERNDKKGCISKDGKELIPCDYTTFGAFADDGLVWVGKRVDKQDHYGIYNTQAHSELLPCVYTKAGVYGKVMTSIDFSKAPNLDSKNICVCKDQKWGIVKQSGKSSDKIKEVTPCQWDAIEYMLPDRAWVWQDGKRGILRDYGTLLQPCHFTNVREAEVAETRASFSSTIYYVQANGKTGLLNDDGTTLAPVEYDGIGDFSDDMAVAKKNGKFGYLNRKGALAITPMYIYASDFSEGLAAVQLPDKKPFFFIGKDNVERFHIKADHVGTYRNGTCKVTKGDKVFYIDKQGKKVKGTTQKIR